MATNNVFKSSTIFGVLRNSDNTTASPNINANAIFDRDINVTGKVNTDRIDSITGRIDLSGNTIDLSGNNVYLGHTGANVYIKDVLYTAATGDVTLAGTNAFTGTNTFNSNLPTSTVTPTTSTQLVTKSYTDSTYASLAGTNAFLGLCSFNNNLPITALTPTLTTQLVPKSFTDATYASKTGTNAFSGTNTFNTNLPTSTIVATPSSTTFLTKQNADSLYAAAGSGVSLTANNIFTGTNTLPTIAVGSGNDGSIYTDIGASSSMTIGNSSLNGTNGGLSLLTASGVNCCNKQILTKHQVFSSGSPNTLTFPVSSHIVWSPSSNGTFNLPVVTSATAGAELTIYKANSTSIITINSQSTNVIYQQNSYTTVTTTSFPAANSHIRLKSFGDNTSGGNNGWEIISGGKIIVADQISIGYTSIPTFISSQIGHTINVASSEQTGITSTERTIATLTNLPIGVWLFVCYGVSFSQSTTNTFIFLRLYSASALILSTTNKYIANGSDQFTCPVVFVVSNTSVQNYTTRMSVSSGTITSGALTNAIRVTRIA